MNLTHLDKLDLEDSQISVFHFRSTSAALSDGCLQFLIYQSSSYNKIILFVKYSICQTVIKSSLQASSTMESSTACETCFQHLFERYWGSVSWQDKIYALFFGCFHTEWYWLKKTRYGLSQLESQISSTVKLRSIFKLCPFICQVTRFPFFKYRSI